MVKFGRIKNSILFKFIIIVFGIIIVFFVFFLWYIQRTESRLLNVMYKMRKQYIEDELKKNVKATYEDRLRLIKERVLRYKKQLEYALFTVDYKQCKEIISDIAMFPSVKEVVVYDLLVSKPFIAVFKNEKESMIFTTKVPHLENLSFLSSDLVYKNRLIGVVKIFYDSSVFMREPLSLKKGEMVALDKEFEFARDALWSSFKGKVISLLLVFAVLYGVLYLFFTEIINKPIHRLEHNLRSFFNFLAGKSGKVRLYDINTNDEIGRMGRFINEGIKVSMEIHQERDKHIKEISRLATVIEQSAESIIITDLKGNIEYVNRTFEKTTGYAFEEVKGRKPNILSSGEHSEKFYKDLWNKITSGDSWQGVFTNRRKDGSIYYERAIIFPIKDPEGKIINYASAKQDITKEKMLEQQLHHMQRMESIGTLAGGVAHDFNNLLTVINGYAELALMSVDSDSPLYKNILPIIEATRRGKNLTTQLLTFSRKHSYKPEVVDINHVISSMEKMVHRLIGEDVDMEMKLTENLPRVKADVSQLEQVFLNLVVNAKDALNAVERTDFQKKIKIETGKVFVDSEIASRCPNLKEDEYVYFAVVDNGIGMDEETKQRIFEPFFTTKEKHKGTGLGLALVYGIVRQNGGCIDVISEVSKGTTFKIYWPISEEQEVERKRVSDRGVVFGSGRILVVEDEEEVRRFTERALLSLGYKVYTAPHGGKALELLNDNLKVDLVITDLIMPGMTGQELVRKIRQMYPDIKVIYVSGYVDNDIVDREVFEENVNFLSKPYSVKQLSLIVQRVLNKED